jgi:hypothetical protein
VVRFNSIEAPIVGENSIGMRLAWRSLRASIRRSDILEHLGVSRAPGRGFFLGSLPALILQLAAIEPHRSMLDCRTPLSSE